MATIKDVAEHAGVSVSTVSYVLSGKRSISEQTRKRVQRSIRKLGYHPNAGARALASSRTNVLALVIPLRTDLNMPVIMQFVASVVAAARGYGYDVLVLTKEGGPDEVRRVAASSTADAVIVMDVEAEDPRVPVLQSLGVPSALIGVPDQPGTLSCVDLDFAAAGALALDHLADLGHRTVGLIGPSPAVYARGTGFAGRFLRGMTTAAQRRGVTVEARPCAPFYDDAQRCGQDLLALGVTGLVVHNEAILSTAVLAVKDRIPNGVSLLAVCPDDVAAHQPVPITSIPIPADEVGTIAVEMVLEQINGTHTPEVRLLSPRLSDRGSTGHRAP